MMLPGIVIGYMVGKQAVRFPYGGNVGVAAIATGFVDTLGTILTQTRTETGDLGQAIVRNVQGDAGSMAGFYLGLQLGKLVGRILPTPKQI